jgi:F420H(2)-dependent quinone reductase
LGGEKFLASEVIDADDYARLYGVAQEVYAGWGDYRQKTGRRIPVFRLTPC